MTRRQLIDADYLLRNTFWALSAMWEKAGAPLSIVGFAQYASEYLTDQMDGSAVEWAELAIPHSDDHRDHHAQVFVREQSPVALRTSAVVRS